MKKVTIKNYRKDTLYPKVVRAVARVLKESDEVSPVDILLQMGNLNAKDFKAWRIGKVPYLERVFQGSLSKANRILQIIGFHIHDLNMIPIQKKYKQQNSKKVLRFSKSGDPSIEKSYSHHYKWNRSQEIKNKITEKALS